MEQNKLYYPQDGKCNDHDPELFFPERGGTKWQIEQAKAVCRQCPVIDECRDFAINSGQKFGIWGGLSEKELSRLISRTKLELGRRAANIPKNKEIA